jgi:hypothetical protein
MNSNQKPTETPTLQSPTNIKLKGWLGPNLARISISYLGIIVVGITAFYFAKQEVDSERQKQMKIKQEINQPNINYPNRFELIKAEKQKQSSQ